MADGQVVFDVRVDTSRVPADIAAMRAAVTAGMTAVSAVTASMAKSIGTAISASFASANVSINAMCAAMTSGGAAAAGSMNALAGSIGAAGAKLAAMCALNTAGVTAMLDKLNSLSLGKIGAATSGIQALTASLYAYVAATAAANAAGLGTGGGGGSSVASSAAAVVATASAAAHRATGLRSGSDYIPYDDYPALLHRGEAVLTSGENEVLKKMGGVNGINGISSVNRQPVTVENKVELNQAAAAPQSINLSVELDGYQVAKAVGKATGELSRQLNARVIKQ